MTFNQKSWSFWCKKKKRTKKTHTQKNTKYMQKESCSFGVQNKKQNNNKDIEKNQKQRPPKIPK